MTDQDKILQIIDNLHFEVEDYLVQGKLVQAKLSLHESEFQSMMSDSEGIEFIKASLATALAKAIISNKLVEFTHISDPLSFQKHIHIRTFITPDDQVRILRSMKNRKNY